MATDTTTKRFTGKVAVVTGSSAEPSIGRSSALRLGHEGASVVINGRDESALAATERYLRDRGIAVASVSGSMEDEATSGRLVDAAVDHFGRIDLVMNTIGGARFQGSFEEMDQGRSDEHRRVQYMARPGARSGRPAPGLGGRRRVDRQHLERLTPQDDFHDDRLCRGEGALNTLTRTMAADLGPRGVRVNAVSPGLTKTTATRAMWERDDGRAAGAHAILGRLTEADDIAAAAAFLLSDDARQITGIVLDVDGGNHLNGGGWTPITPRGPAAS